MSLVRFDQSLSSTFLFRTVQKNDQTQPTYQATYVSKYLSYVKFIFFNLVPVRITVTMISFSKSSSIGARCLECSLLSKITLATVTSITAMPISPTCRIARSYTVPVVTAPSFRSCHWVGLWSGVCTEIKGKFTQLKFFLLLIRHVHFDSYQHRFLSHRIRGGGTRPMFGYR